MGPPTCDEETPTSAPTSKGAVLEKLTLEVLSVIRGRTCPPPPVLSIRGRGLARVKFGTFVGHFVCLSHGVGAACLLCGGWFSRRARVPPETSGGSVGPSSSLLLQFPLLFFTGCWAGLIFEVPLSPEGHGAWVSLCRAAGCVGRGPWGPGALDLTREPQGSLLSPSPPRGRGASPWVSPFSRSPV